MGHRRLIPGHDQDAVRVTLIFFPSLSEAHRGRLDTHGCHHNRKVGNYECHKQNKKGSVPFLREYFAHDWRILKENSQRRFSGRIKSSQILLKIKQNREMWPYQNGFSTGSLAIKKEI